MERSGTVVEQPLKILAIQFKFLGDAVLMIPALQAIRNRYPDCALHVLVPEAAAPLLRGVPFITRLAAMPRTRRKARLRETWPLIRALRAERFDRSVDFEGNDRGAILSLLSGARERLGPICDGGFFGRRFCYNQRVAPAPLHWHETLRLLDVLAPWGIKAPSPIEIEIHADPALDGAAAQLLPSGSILCHISCNISKKEWPLRHWAELYRGAKAGEYHFVFSAGPSPREQALLQELRGMLPGASTLPPLELPTFLAVLKRARAVISNDTGPMHFAAALGVPTLGLFGPTRVASWGPVGKQHHVIEAPKCNCDSEAHVCHSPARCLADISPGQVLGGLQTLLAKNSR